MYQFLRGLRVVEIASFIAGPSCGLYFAQMGAEVIRIDDIGGGPDFKRWPLAESGSSLYWEGLNKGKKSVALDLRSPRGRELALAIAAAPGENAGLVITNQPAQGFLSYERLKAARPDIICVRVMGWADGAPAMDYTVNAATGLPGMTGFEDDGRPINHVLPAWDLICGAYSAFALMTAERERRRIGQGAEVRVALSDIAAASLAHIGAVAEVLAQGESRARVGNALFGAFGRDFTTSDGERVMVVAISPRQWQGLLTGLDLADAVRALENELGVSFARDEGARFRCRDRLFPLFEAAIGKRPLSELSVSLDAASVTWSKYQSLYEAATTDVRLFVENPIFKSALNPSGLRYPIPGASARIEGVQREPAQPAPMLGRHTDEILSSVLGLSGNELGELHTDGVVAS